MISQELLAFRECYRSLAFKIKQHEKEMKEVKAEMQKICKHLFVVQEKQYDGYSLIRCCEVCGLIEKASWEGAFKKLKSKRTREPDSGRSIYYYEDLDYDLEF
jgi:hypothetical protein